ncbi:MAG: hypothetical protein HKN27_08965 [Silicimonas sp.]|nr:hypothetical protein [Silicimonas sp.]
MRLSRLVLMTVITVCLATAAWAQSVALDHGGDTYIAGSVVNEAVDTAGDTFVSARSAVAMGTSQGDLHVTGFDVSVSADTAQDLYAIGATVVLRGDVAQDMTVAGFSVRTESTAETKGNARLFGNTLTIEGPVEGALMATGVDVILNAPIAGDARILAHTLSFGPNAKVGGTLTYAMERQIDVPERVAPAERVVFEKAEMKDAWDGFDEMRREMPVLPTFMSVFAGFIVSLLFFVVLGAVMLGFMPKRLEALRQSIALAPGRSILLGVIGLSMLFGLVPITALTIVGLPFVPIAILAIVVVWTLGYALAAYAVAMRIWAAFGGEEDAGNVARLLVFAAAITFIALLNFIPFVGWVANYTLVLLGIGAITKAVFQYMIGSPALALDVDLKSDEN